MQKCTKNIEKIRKAVLAKFVCQGCGNCCKIEQGFVHVNLVELQAIAKFLGLNEIDFMRQYIVKNDGELILSSPKHNKNCFLDENNKCKIYPVRPIACTTYPNWPYLWRSWEAFVAETDQCPGLKKALKKISS
jgi:Fe-S-cluster containining protein